VIEAGDIIIMPHEDYRLLSIGSDQGHYSYRYDFPSGVRHTRKVRWFKTPIPRTHLPTDIAKSLATPLTVARIARNGAVERIQTVLPAVGDVPVGKAWFPIPPRVRERQLPRTHVIVGVETRQGLGSLPALTPNYLEIDLIPFLSALDHLNRAVIIAQGQALKVLSLVELRQRTPVKIELKDLAKETLEVARDELIPWRREHQKRLAKIEEREREAEAELKEAKTEEAREIVEAKRLQNEKDRFDLGCKKLEFALDLATKLDPDADAKKRMQIALQIGAAVDKIAPSNLMLTLPNEGFGALASSSDSN
jgi:hypothetical protein